MSTFQPSALSNPNAAIVIKSVPSDVDSTQVAYTPPNPWTPSAAASQAGQAGAGIMTMVTSYLKKDDEPMPSMVTTPVVEEPAMEWTPWIVGGVAVVGVLGAVWAFWPREK